MPLTRDDIGILGYGIKTALMQDIAAAPNTDYLKFCTVVPSGAGRASENYAWLSDLPQMREWVAHNPRQASDLSQSSYSITNKKYENTLSLEREAVDSDQYGVIRTRISQLADSAVRAKERNVMAALLNADATVGPDGQYFVDTDHQGSQSNKATAALSMATLEAAIAAMRSFANSAGDNYGMVPDTLLVGPKLQGLATALCQSAVVVAPVGSGTASTGATASTPYANWLQGTLTPVVSNYFTASGKTQCWALLCTKSPLKPIILQQSDEIEVSSATTGDHAFEYDEYRYGVRERYGIGYSLWPLMYMSVVA